MSEAAIARVVPDLASFSVDHGFEYAIGDHDVEVGSLVRVPLSGRPRRGYVVDVYPGDASHLKEIRGVSGDLPVFSPALLQAIDELAAYYVAPRSVVLAKSLPPNLPRRVPRLTLPSIPPSSSPAPAATAAAAAGQPGGHVQLLAGAGWGEIIRGSVTEILSAQRSAIVVVPTAVEADRLLAVLRPDLGARVLDGHGDDAAVTRAWSEAALNPGVVVVGTAKVAWWKVARLAAIVLVDEGRRGMKERQTPTVAAARLAATRAHHEGLTIFHLSRLPTADTFARDPLVVRLGGRLWPPVEIVDRTGEPPGSRLFTARVTDSVRATLRDQGRVFLFTHRRGYAPAARCGSCRQLRLCPGCGARPDAGAECRRCGSGLGPCSNCGHDRFEPLGAGIERVTEEARRLFDPGVASDPVADGPALVVGTERDLVALRPVDLAVAIDGDGLVRGTNYRAGEDALAVLARVAARVRSGPRHRLMVQTASPGHPVYEALRKADPVPYLEHELSERKAMGLPPTGEILVLEVSDADEAGDEIRAVSETATVFGPAAFNRGQRWLIQGADLTEPKQRLRAVIGRLREHGARVRADADPRDL